MPTSNGMKKDKLAILHDHDSLVGSSTTSGDSKFLLSRRLSG
jgi:hypothetical protein